VQPQALHGDRQAQLEAELAEASAENEQLVDAVYRSVDALRYAYTPNFASDPWRRRERAESHNGRHVGMHRPSHHGNEFQAPMRTRRPRSWRAVSVAGMALALALAECSVLAADKRGVWTWTPAVSSTDSKRVQEVCASLPRACVRAAPRTLHRWRWNSAVGLLLGRQCKYLVLLGTVG
jgi:hypothetical protein